MNERGWFKRLQNLVGGDAKRARDESSTSPNEVVFSVETFPVSADLFDALQRARDAARQDADELERKLDAFILDPGLGPPVYLARDGHVVWDGWYEWTSRPPLQLDAVASIVVGARKTGVRELLDLLPPRPASARECSACAGTRRVDLPSADGGTFPIVCPSCRGLGWTTNAPELGPKTIELLMLLDGMTSMLRAVGEEHWCRSLEGDATKIRSGNVWGLDHFLGSFGGAGSLNDWK